MKRLIALCIFVAGLQCVCVRLSSAQTAQFQGTVLADAPGEKPLANAEIVFTKLNRSVRSDSLGNFLLDDIPLGKHAIVIRRVGYESINTEITLTTSKPPGVDLMLKPITTKLATVETKAEATGLAASRLAEFDERRKSGIGKFLTAEYFEEMEGRPVSSFLLQKIAGLNHVKINGRTHLISLRGNAMRGSAPCYMQVVVNGIVRPGMFDIDELNAKDIIGFEFHTTATTPPQYNATRGSSCGTVIIWTK